MLIGVPREIWPQEGRVALSPSTALRLVRAGHALVVQQGEEFVPVAGGFGAPAMLPEGYRIELVQALPTGDSCISFTPTGRTQPARIRVISDQGESVEIECATPAELFRVVGP